MGVVASLVAVEFDKWKLLGTETVAEAVGRKTDPVLDPEFFLTDTAGRKTDPFLDPKIPDDISDCLSFAISGVTSAESENGTLSSRSPKPNDKSRSKP